MNEKPIKVGIQGVRAAFHDVAAQQHFIPLSTPIEPVECATFRDLCETLREGRSDCAMMAIENSIAGSILPNFSLLEKFRFQIVGEEYLRIEMNLMALPGTKVGDLEVVQSHPMAIAQCDDFLNAHPHIKIIESRDTAESARDVAEKKMTKTAAIASRLAAETYGLEILKAGIETNKQNYTRFLVIVDPTHDHRRLSSQGPHDKSSIRFEVRHQSGSLAQVLNIFTQYEINMTKIQSLPILGKPTQYSFHVDLEWEDLKRYHEALEDIKSKTDNLISFGEYQRSRKTFQ